MRLRHVVGLAAVVAASALGGCASGSRFTLYEENDALSLRTRSDRYYTQGARATWVFPTEHTPEPVRSVARGVPAFGGDVSEAVGIVLGQSIYTPENIERRRLIEDDRPYAGWSYVGLLLQDADLSEDGPAGDDADTLEIDLGVVGPWSQADETQIRFHTLTNADRPRGWRHQLENEVGGVIRYEHRHRLLAAELPLGLGTDLIGGFGAALGNVATHGELNALVRFGLTLPRDFGVNTISRTVMDFAQPADGFSLYVYGGGMGRAVGRNIFLDGNTFRDSHDVDKEYLIGEVIGGVALEWGAWRLTFSQVARSEEFEEQDGSQYYGSLSLSFTAEF